MSPQATTDTPWWTDARYDAQSPDWTLVNDVLGGTRALVRKQETYIPKARGESDDKYARRIARSRFYNVYARTLKGLVGRVFRVPPKLGGDADDTLLKHAENIDGIGTHLSVFARRLMMRGVHHGHAAILVDAPKDPTKELGRKPTRGDERAMGMRPFWRRISAPDIQNVRTAVVGGREVLDVVSILEAVDESDGQYGVERVEQLRVLLRNNGAPKWEVWRKNDSGEAVKRDDGAFSNVTEIPLIPYYAADDPIDWFQTEPPLLSLAEANLDHYAIQSDHRYSMHVANTPMPVIVGWPDEKALELNVEKGLRLPTGGDAFFMAHKGEAHKDNREEMAILEDRMAALGLQAMARRTRQAETAEAKRIDQLEQESTLAVAARGLQDAMEQAWQVHAQMVGLESPSITINFDFDGLSLSPEEMREIREQLADRVIDLDTVWDILEAGGRLPEDFDRELVRERLEREGEQTPPEPGAGDELDDEE